MDHPNRSQAPTRQSFDAPPSYAHPNDDLARELSPSTGTLMAAAVQLTLRVAEGQISRTLRDCKHGMVPVHLSATLLDGFLY